MIPQSEFDTFVKDYNADFLYVISRASMGNYHCLLTSCRVLKDFHQVILRLYELGGVRYDIVPYPFTFRASDAFLEELGYNGDAIKHIRGFLAYVKSTHGKELEECLEQKLPVHCGPP